MASFTLHIFYLSSPWFPLHPGSQITLVPLSFLSLYVRTSFVCFFPLYFISSHVPFSPTYFLFYLPITCPLPSSFSNSFRPLFLPITSLFSSNPLTLSLSSLPSFFSLPPPSHAAAFSLRTCQFSYSVFFIFLLSLFPSFIHRSECFFRQMCSCSFPSQFPLQHSGSYIALSNSIFFLLCPSRQPFTALSILLFLFFFPHVVNPSRSRYFVYCFPISFSTLAVHISSVIRLFCLSAIFFLPSLSLVHTN